MRHAVLNDDGILLQSLRVDDGFNPDLIPKHRWSVCVGGARLVLYRYDFVRYQPHRNNAAFSYIGYKVFELGDPALFEQMAIYFAEIERSYV